MRILSSICIGHLLHIYYVYLKFKFYFKPMARFIGLLPRHHLREFRIYIFVTKKEEDSINKYVCFSFK